jgi:hypothetical protein
MSRIFCALLLSVTLISCQKKGEADDLAKAQACLDAVPLGEPSKADDCLPMVKDYTDQQAMILKCAIVMTSGGLMEDKIIKGYNALKDDTQTNKTAAFMAALALDKPDLNTGYTKALEANGYCQASGVKGLQYLGGVIVAGTFMNKIAGAIDVSDPTQAQTAITNLINQCVTTPAASCTDDLPALGAAVTGLAGSYCGGATADQDVCGQVNSAVAAAGGSSTNVGKAMLCYLNKKTFSAADGLCH